MKRLKPTPDDLLTERVADTLSHLSKLRVRVLHAACEHDHASAERLWKTLTRLEQKEQERTE